MKLSTRLVLAMGALVLLTAAVFVLIAWRDVQTAVLPRALQHLELDTRLLTAELDGLLQGARADVGGFRTGAGPEGVIRARRNGGVDPVDGATEAAWRARRATRLRAIVAAKPAYLQFRLIALEDGGREIVRIDRTPDGGARILGDAEMQRKGDAAYFKEAVALPAGTLHLSKIEFNREHGAVERPYVPVMRVATPLHSADGKPFGIVALNLDLRPVFERIRAGARAGAQAYVVNERGEFLVHPDRSREFGFEFNSLDILANDFRDFPALHGRSATSRLVTAAGGETFGAAVVPVELSGARRVAVIQTVPYADIMAPATAVFQASVYAAIAATGIALALAVFLSRGLARPLVQVTNAAEALGRGETLPVPVSAGGEIGVLARAFARMATDNRNKTSALKLEIAERRRLFETSRDLILITDRKGTFLQVSPSCEAILGYRPEEMTGRSAINFIYPEDLDHTRRQMRQVRRGHASAFETRYVHRNRRVVTLAWTGVWSDPEQRYFFIGRDMTEQKAAERVTTQALVRLQAVSNCAMIGIITLNESGSVESLNPAAEAMFGVTFEAVSRRDVGRLIDLGGPANVSSAARLHHLIADGGGVRELEGRRSDRTTFPMDFELADMPVGDRRMFVVFVREITARKRHERMKDAFVATVSPELRAPMTSPSSRPSPG